MNVGRELATADRMDTSRRTLDVAGFGRNASVGDQGEQHPVGVQDRGIHRTSMRRIATVKIQYYVTSG